MRTKRTKLYEAIQYIEEKREDVLFYERELSKIKKGQKWKSSMNYLKVAQHTRMIDEMPGVANDYRTPVVLSKNEI